MAAELNDEKKPEVGDIYTRSSEGEHKMPGQATILIIDDEKAVRDSCCHVLSYDGYRAETAVDGDTGLQKIRELKPDLVLVDLKMPGISGMELLEKIGDIDPKIVSIVISGYATVELAEEAMKRNAHDFLCKPFTPQQLRIIVERGLGQSIDGKAVAKRAKSKEIKRKRHLLKE